MWASCRPECLAGTSEAGFTWGCEQVSPLQPRTSEACIESCRQKDECRQAVFHGDGGSTCHLSLEQSHKVFWVDDVSDSSFCGSYDEQNHTHEVIKKVRKQLPWKMDVPPLVTCSWTGEDCSETRCCNDYVCDKDFAVCSKYSCYKKDDNFSGCAANRPDGWEGTWLGGPREHRTVPSAAKHVAVQANTLYCFTVVAWHAPRPKPDWNSEAEIANHWQKEGLHIMQCDGHDFFEGNMTPVAEWGAFSNVDMFMTVWQQLKHKKKWEKYGWTVKVDSDAVFLPDRLKDHLFNLRTPVGSRVYIENIDFHFKFLGALEIMSREALAVFLKLGHTCVRGIHEGGEDIFMKACLDGLGIDHQSDFQLLRDQFSGVDVNCADGWVVAFHYRKTVQSWTECYNDAVCATEGEGCDKGVAVPDAL